MAETTGLPAIGLPAIGLPATGLPGSQVAAPSTFAVQRGDWPDLAPEQAAMVAPPVTVSATPVGRPVGPWRKAQLARSRSNVPDTRHRRPTR
jgi:hypothetical protein